MPIVITEDYIRAHLPVLPETAHKGDFGRLGVMAGSYGMAGAAAFAIGAAYRSGAGLVYGFVPQSIYGILATICPNAVFYPVDSQEEWKSAQLSRPDAWVIGCGMGNTEATAQTAQRLIALNKPFVLDADGINALAGCIECSKGKKAVLTPHEAEAARVLGCSADMVAGNRFSAVQQLAEKSGAVAVLKGHHTLISDRETVFVCEAGNNGMATAGSGDVLAGMIGAFLAQGCTPTEAAVMGVYLHARAGDTAAAQLSRRSLCAMDILAALPEVFKAFEG
ncbi:MAG: NAD(P)H-hydrate dehydratase [Clostridia bacterium]|nr:NAD(P)H-hydrate dehydratase [Clostridia bacterium]